MANMKNSTRSQVFRALFIASAFSSLAACSSDALDEDTDAVDDEARRRVKPRGGNGAFEFVAPSFASNSFGGTFAFASEGIKAGDRREKVPATYTLTSGGRWEF